MWMLVAAPVFAATKITVAHPWDTTSETGKGLENVLKLWKQKYPDIEVELMPGVNAEKFITLALGGVPPDVVFVDGPVVSSWAVRGLISPLSQYIKASGVSRNDFVPPAWRQNEWAGDVWAMTILVDPNFALIWNNDLFAKAGLDSAAGPRTVREFESYFQKLTRREGGRLAQIGMVPWDVYGNTNTMYTWGWIFGGEFYDSAKQVTTAHDPLNVKALTWLRDYHQRYNADAGGLNSGLPTGRNRFTAGREAMRFAVTANVFNFLQVAPEIDIGIGKMPYDEAASNKNPAWVGGWTIAIANGSKHPDAAWKFMHYVTATAEGTSAFASASGWFPAYLKSPAFLERFAKDKYLSVYMNILLEASHQRPVIPVQQVYWDELDKAVVEVLNHRIQPAPALQFVSQRVDDELAKLLAQTKR